MSTSAAPRRSVDAAGATRLIGRDEERARVESFLGSIALGPATLVICGEAGIGRSTLWQHTLGSARQRGLQVRAIRASADDRARPAAALVDLLGRDAHAEVLHRASSLPSFERGRLTLELLRRLAADGPVLLGVDDQQWLDAESANALRFALDRLTDEPVGTVVTESGEPVILVGRHAERVELGPLPAGVLRQVLTRSLPTISRPDLLRAHKMANGNPTGALQLVRSWLRERQGGLQVDDDHGLARHVLDLPEDAATVMRTLAVAGPSPAGVIAASAEVDDFEAAARAAVDAGVVQVADDLTMRFTHTLYANAVRATINPLDRRAIHGRLAGAVASPEAAALHLASATLLPDEDVAAQLEGIAESCAHRGACDQAAELAAHSARLTPPTRADDAARRAVREVEYRAAAGETARALALADRLVGTLGRGWQRAEALTLRVYLDFADSERFLRQALDDVGNDPGFRARTLDLLGWQLGLYRGRLADGIAASTKALALSRALADDETTCVATATLAEQLTLTGRPSEELFADSVQRAEKLRAFPLGRWPRVFRARALLWAGQLDAARREFLDMQKHAVVLGSEFQRPYRLCDLALVDVHAGDLDGAVRRAEEGIEAARDAGNEHAIIWLAHPLGLAAALQGRSEQARRAADLLDDWGETNDEPPRHTMADEIRGNLAATGGDWPQALEHFASMTERLDAMGYAHPGARPGLPRAVEAAATAGDRARCQVFVDRLRAQAEALGAPLVDAHVSAALGQLALLDGKRDAAVEQLDAAVTGYEKLGYRFDAGRIGLALARAWLRCGQRSRARAAAEVARVAFADASAPGWVAAADELLRRAGASGSQGSLTRTETQIASLVAAGRTNREIAAELFISVSTVEAHLTRLYRKLGLRRRTELTSWLHADG